LGAGSIDIGKLQLTPGWGSSWRVDVHPIYASWANPIEAHFGRLRQFVLSKSDRADHPALGRSIRSCLRWGNSHILDSRVLEAD